MRKLIFTLLLILAGYVGYMYFFGKGDDKANARVIVQETKDVTKAIGDFIRTQKDKYDSRQVDSLIRKSDETVNRLHSDDTENSVEQQKSVDELRDALRDLDTTKLNDEQRKLLKDVLRDLDKK